MNILQNLSYCDIQKKKRRLNNILNSHFLLNSPIKIMLTMIVAKCASVLSVFEGFLFVCSLLWQSFGS